MPFTYIEVVPNGEYLEYVYNDYSPLLAAGMAQSGTAVSSVPKGLRAKSYLTEISLVIMDLLDANGAVAFADAEVVLVEEDGRQSYAIGNNGTVDDPIEGYAYNPNIYVIQSVDGNSTTTSAAVYDEIKALLA